jgi:hypothetical protein
MSYYLIDFTKKEQNFDFDNIIIGKKINSDQKYFKYYIYYEENNTASELYIKLPKLRTIYNLSNHKFNSLNLPIYPEFEATTNFISFIKTLENNILECFNKKNKEFVSLISKKESLQFIKMSTFENINITSNINKDITINDFKINSQLEIVIKLSYIWANQTKLGLSSQVYQIKYWAPPEQSEINFIDSETEKPIKKLSMQPTISVPTLLQPIQPIQQTTKNVNMRPSLADLNNAIKSLKNIKK